MGTGYPELSVNFDYSDIQAPVVVGEEISLVVGKPTSSLFFIVTRNITIQGVTQRECNKNVQCIATNTIDGARKIDVSSRVITIDGEWDHEFISFGSFTIAVKTIIRLLFAKCIDPASFLPLSFGHTVQNRPVCLTSKSPIY